MKILLTYLKQHKQLLILALVLASINQCFSLCDSIITGKLINKFSAPHTEDATYYWKTGDSLNDFIASLSVFLGLSIGAAMMSRIAISAEAILLHLERQNRFPAKAKDQGPTAMSSW